MPPRVCTENRERTQLRKKISVLVGFGKTKKQFVRYRIFTRRSAGAVALDRRRRRRTGEIGEAADHEEATERLCRAEAPARLDHVLDKRALRNVFHAIARHKTNAH